MNFRCLQELLKLTEERGMSSYRLQVPEMVFASNPIKHGDLLAARKV